MADRNEAMRLVWNYAVETMVRALDEMRVAVENFANSGRRAQATILLPSLVRCYYG